MPKFKTCSGGLGSKQAQAVNTDDSSIFGGLGQLQMNDTAVSSAGLLIRRKEPIPTRALSSEKVIVKLSKHDWILI